MRNKEHTAQKRLGYLRNYRKPLEKDQGTVFDKQGVDRPNKNRVLKKQGAGHSRREFEKEGANWWKGARCETGSTPLESDYSV